MIWVSIFFAILPAAESLKLVHTCYGGLMAFGIPLLSKMSRVQFPVGGLVNCYPRAPHFECSSGQHKGQDETVATWVPTTNASLSLSSCARAFVVLFAPKCSQMCDQLAQVKLLFQVYAQCSKLILGYQIKVVSFKLRSELIPSGQPCIVKVNTAPFH